MDAKLTLRLNNEIIEEAKRYARDKNVSLSKLIESYLAHLVVPDKTENISPLVKSLSGVVKLPKNFDEKKEYRKHLTDKYSH